MAKQYGVQCRIPVRDADDWDPPVVDPQGAPGSMPGEQVVFDANKESEGHDFFRLGGLDLSKDGRWMLYGVDVAGDERYDFRIRDLAGLETGEPVSELPEQFTGIGSACFTPDGQAKYCPHGRPIARIFTRYELEKLFGRQG